MINIKNFFNGRVYKFTNKKVSPQSVMSTVLGIVSLAGMIIRCVLSFKAQGNVNTGIAITCFLCLAFAVTGLVEGIRARLTKDMYYFLAYTGIVLNAVCLIFIMYVFGLGIMD